MKLSWLITGFLILACPHFSDAQGKGNKGHKGRKKQKVYRSQSYGPPPWAPAHGYRAKQHVYFPDYYTYYDPNRGYVYWSGGRWVVSRNMPSFLMGVDLGRARIQVLNDIGLSVRPELNYVEYMRRYPAVSVDIWVPVPR